MTISWMVVWDIAKPVLAAGFGAAVARALERRPQLIAFFQHSSAIRVQGEAGTYTVHTHAIVVRNAGKRPATNVRVGHATLPYYSIYPDVPVDRRQLPQGVEELVFPVLVPGEQVTISYLYFPPTTWDKVHAGIKFDEGFARQLNVVPTPQLPRWQLLAMWMLMLIGIVGVMYAGIELVEFTISMAARLG